MVAETDTCCITDADGRECGKPVAISMDEPGGGMMIPMCEEHAREIGFIDD